VALETHVLDLVSIHVEIDMNLVSAQGVVSLGIPVGVGHGPPISRRLVVVEDEFLIKLAEH
jgi:hypothetical protein